MTMRLIDADGLVREICREECERAYEDCDYTCSMVAPVVNAPTIEAEPVRHGRWFKKPAKYNGESRCSYCSECLYTGRKSWKYCPNCGAKMEEVTDA